MPGKKKEKPHSGPQYGFILPLFLLFLLIQLIGVYLGYKTILAMQQSMVEPVQEASFGFLIFFEILLVTVFVLVIIRYAKSFLKAFILVPTSVFIVFFFMDLLDGIIPQPLPVWIGAIAAIALICSAVMRKDMLSQNLIIILSVTWASANVGAMIGFAPVLVLAILLAFYDFVAVFKTKHMVTMAKEIVAQKIPATMVIPTKEHVYQLGGGDLFIPIMMSVSIIRELSLTAALFTLTGACIGMAGIFAYMTGKKKMPLPALPPIVACALLGLLAYLVITRLGLVVL
jgi:presenilin-like A22 family membrane protease